MSSSSSSMKERAPRGWWWMRGEAEMLASGSSTERKRGRSVICDTRPITSRLFCYFLNLTTLTSTLAVVHNADSTPENVLGDAKANGEGIREGLGALKIPRTGRMLSRPGPSPHISSFLEIIVHFSPLRPMLITVEI